MLRIEAPAGHMLTSLFNPVVPSFRRRFWGRLFLAYAIGIDPIADASATAFSRLPRLRRHRRRCESPPTELPYPVPAPSDIKPPTAAGLPSPLPSLLRPSVASAAPATPFLEV